MPQLDFSGKTELQPSHRQYLLDRKIPEEIVDRSRAVSFRKRFMVCFRELSAAGVALGLALFQTQCVRFRHGIYSKLCKKKSGNEAVLVFPYFVSDKIVSEKCRRLPKEFWQSKGGCRCRELSAGMLPRTWHSFPSTCIVSTEGLRGALGVGPQACTGWMICAESTSLFSQRLGASIRVRDAPVLSRRARSTSCPWKQLDTGAGN